MSAMENLLDGNWWDDSTDNGQDEDLDWSLQQAYPTEWPSQPWRDEEAARDFPNAMDPHSWYRNPPMDEGTPRPFSQTRLGSLPREVLQVIWIMLAGSDYGHYCEITNEDGQYERPRSGPEYLRLHDCGYLLIGMSRELGVCQEMRGALMDGIMRSTMYRCWDYHRLPETISDLRFSGHLHLIQNMTLDLSKLSNWGSAKRFPEILGLICGEMPGLEHFIIHTKHDDSKPAYVEAESGDPESSLVTRSQQETRLLLQLAAFFVLRHPNLDVMTTEHPVEPETWEQTHNRCTTVQLFSRRLHENVIRDVARSKPLDATNEAEPKIRRHLWTEIAQMDLEKFVIPSADAYTEPPEEAKRFERVDQEGYVVPNREKPWIRGPSVDSLIIEGREREALSEPVTSAAVETVLQIRNR